MKRLLLLLLSVFCIGVSKAEEQKSFKQYFQNYKQCPWAEGKSGHYLSNQTAAKSRSPMWKCEKCDYAEERPLFWLFAFKPSTHFGNNKRNAYLFNTKEFEHNIADDALGIFYYSAVNLLRMNLQLRDYTENREQSYTVLELTLDADFMQRYNEFKKRYPGQQFGIVINGQANLFLIDQYTDHQEDYKIIARGSFEGRETLFSKDTNASYMQYFGIEPVRYNLMQVGNKIFELCSFIAWSKSFNGDNVFADEIAEMQAELASLYEQFDIIYEKWNKLYPNWYFISSLWREYYFLCSEHRFTSDYIIYDMLLNESEFNTQLNKRLPKELELRKNAYYAHFKSNISNYKSLQADKTNTTDGNEQKNSIRDFYKIYKTIPDFAPEMIHHARLTAKAAGEKDFCL